METLLFFILIGYAFHFISTQQDEEYEKKSHKFFKDLFKSNEPSKHPELDYVLGKLDKPPISKDKHNISDFPDMLETFLGKHEYSQLQNQKHTYFKSDIWITIRRDILKRDNYQCQLCLLSIPDVLLNVHHKTYKNLFKEKSKELITLCTKCHTQTHEQLGYPSKDNSEMYKQIFWSEELDQKVKANQIKNAFEQAKINQLI